MTDRNPQRPWLLLPIETKSRELWGTTLLACAAAERGYGVIMGTKPDLDKVLRYMPRGFFIDKAIADHNLGQIRSRKQGGNHYGCIDEEGLIILNEKEYVSTRISKETLNETDVVFCWGEHQARAIAEYFPEERSRLKVTGNPRVDMWAPKFREVFREKANDFSRELGPYILVCTNFSDANNYLGADYLLKVAAKDNTIRQRIEYRKPVFEAFQAMILRLSEQFPTYKIVVRPHPGENNETWKRVAETLPNVVMRSDGEITPWILGSRLVIHNASTSGVEAYFLDVPVISYRPKKTQWDLELPMKVSREAFDEAELLREMHQILDDGISYTLPKENEAFLRDNLLFEGSLAIERIMNEIDALSLPQERYGSLPLSFYATDLTWRTVRTGWDLLSRTPLRSMGRLGEQIRLRSYARKKNVPLRKKDVAQCVEKLSEVSGRFKNVHVRASSQSCVTLHL